MKVHGGADNHTAARGRPHTGAGGYGLKEDAASEEPITDRPLSGAVVHEEELMLEQIFWQDLWPHGRPALEHSAPEGLCPVERTQVEAVREGLCTVRETPRWSRGRVWGGRSSRHKAF